MEESRGVYEDKEKDEGPGLLAFFYGDALVEHVVNSEGPTPRETIRLAYKEVR